MKICAVRLLIDISDICEIKKNKFSATKKVLKDICDLMTFLSPFTGKYIKSTEEK